MTWIRNFITWLREGQWPDASSVSAVQETPMEMAKAVVEKAKEKIVIVSSKKMSDDIRDELSPEALLSDLRSISPFSQIAGPSSDDILKELKKISQEIVHRNQ